MNDNDWVPIEEPDPRKWETTPTPEIDPCHGCGTNLGHVEAEYEGQYGLRLVQVWVECWVRPESPNVFFCEDCTVREEADV